MNISVLGNEWGKVSQLEIENLLKEAASHIDKELNTPFTEEIYVKWWDKDYPFVEYQDNPDQPHIIKLTAQDRHWCQYVYQFAHEFCHVLSNYDRLKDCKNEWFHEAICELASIFTLRRMDRKGWFGEKEGVFQWYERNEVREKKCQEIKGIDETKINLMDWLSDYEEEMRDISTERNINGDRHKGYRAIYALVAYALLPVFEENPNGWNTIRTLPPSNSRIEQYLKDWLQSTDKDQNQSFIRLCQKRMQSKITPFEI